MHPAFFIRLDLIASLYLDIPDIIQSLAVLLSLYFSGCGQISPVTEEAAPYSSLVLPSLSFFTVIFLWKIPQVCFFSAS